MRRRLLNLTTVLSLLLLVITAVLWGRSYAACDRWAVQRPLDAEYTTQRRYGSVESWTGELRVSYIPLGSDFRFDNQYYWRRGGFTVARTLLHIREMTLLHAPEPPSFMSGPALEGYVVGVPHWFLAVGSAVMPLARLHKRVGRGQRRGSCRNCGYDLRATPARCPECGTVPDAVKAAA